MWWLRKRTEPRMRRSENSEKIARLVVGHSGRRRCRCLNRIKLNERAQLSADGGNLIIDLSKFYDHNWVVLDFSTTKRLMNGCWKELQMRCPLLLKKFRSNFIWDLFKLPIRASASSFPRDSKQLDLTFFTATAALHRTACASPSVLTAFRIQIYAAVLAVGSQQEREASTMRA